MLQICPMCGVEIEYPGDDSVEIWWCSNECYVQYTEQEKEDGRDSDMWRQGDEGSVDN